jgi:hypothetical protein
MRTVQIPLLCLGGMVALATLAVAQHVAIAANLDAIVLLDADDLKSLEEHDFEARLEEEDFEERDRHEGTLHQEMSLKTGFLFIDGEFVPAPYRISVSDDGNQVLVNDREVPGAIIHPLPGSRRPGERGVFDNADRSRGEEDPPARRAARRIRHHLGHGTAIVAFSNLRMQTLLEVQTYALLKALLEPDTVRSELIAEVLEIPIGRPAKARWNQWLTEFPPPDAALRRQAEPFITRLEAAEASNLANIAAVRRFEAVAYPLTLLGMLLSVVAFGHLLMSLPNNDAMRRGASDGVGGISSEVIHATMISVLLVGALSSLDLIWTLLASQAGQMRELNPIASHFINDPLSLIAFKASATILGCGLLYALRRHSRAQLASWWMCLVCTMLTFRWLVFNSMFVT